MIPIRTALISVSDKTGLAELAQGLARFKIKILSTGGTAKFLAAQQSLLDSEGSKQVRPRADFR